MQKDITPTIDKRYLKNSDHFKRIASNTFHKLRFIVPLYKRIRALESEIKMLTSYSSDTIYRLRYNSMTYDYVSPAIVKLLGFTPEQMKKINFRSLIIETKIISNGIKKINSFEDLEQSRQKGDVQRWQADYLVRTKDGRKIWVTDISYPWFDECGKIIGSIGSLRDISTRVKAEEQRQKELIRLANSDPLTGLANRRIFFKTIDNELKRFKRSSNDFSMLLIDIDHFKKVNDTHGHQTGDKVICEVGEVIKSCLRETDMLARIGGEEFGIFLPDTPEQGAFWVAERICTTIAKHNFFTIDSVMPINCTVSIGVSSTSSLPEADSAELYKQADSRLYIAKHTGRNQVSVDEIMQLH